MRYLDLITERAGAFLDRDMNSDKILDLRDPQKKAESGSDFEVKTCLCITKSGTGIIYYWGDYNTKAWKEVMNLVSAQGTSDAGASSFEYMIYKNGIIISRGREFAQWSGDRNRYSKDLADTVRAFVNCGIATSKTPFYLGSGVGTRSIELLGSAEKVIAAASEIPSRLTLYHGTSSARLSVILRDGLKPLDLDERVWNKGGVEKVRPEHREDSVYLTASPEQAEYYANKAVKTDRVRLGPTARIRAKTNLANGKRQIEQFNAELARYQAMSPEQIAVADEHAAKYSYGYSETIAQKIIYIPNKIKNAESIIRLNSFAASIEQDGPIKPVILQITLGVADMKKLMADDDFLRLHGDADPTDWQQSLSVFAQVAYRGSIPPNRIKIKGGK